MINGGVVNYPAPITRRVDVDGHLTIDLAANTDTGTTPAGVTYKVAELLNGTTRIYYVSIPHDQGSTLDLSTLTAVTAAPDVSQWTSLLSEKVDKSAALLAWTYAQAFRLVSATRDANEAITTASVVWPDGVTGTFTTDTASTAFPGAIDAYHVTYGARTITQSAVTRDAGGAVTAQPALVVT